MGRSARRVKQGKPLILKRKHKTPHTKSKLPHEITDQRPSLQNKLGVGAEWDETKKIDGNYAGSGFVLDATARFGRNSRPDQVQRRAAELAARPEAEGDVPLDDDLTAMMAQVRAAGKAAPKRPTPHQRQIVARLAAAHGEDVGAMAMDRRLNPMQHSRGVLERLIAAVAYWEEGSGVDFRVPTTRLW